MTANLLDEALATAARDVLETMFFTTTCDEPSEQSCEDGLLRVLVRFRGTPSGRFALEIASAPARIIAAGFLGEEPENLSDVQVLQVVFELANMICGATLSCLDDEKTFDLSSPELAALEPEPACECSSQLLHLEEGSLRVCLKWQP